MAAFVCLINFNRETECVVMEGPVLFKYVAAATK